MHYTTFGRTSINQLLGTVLKRQPEPMTVLRSWIEESPITINDVAEPPEDEIDTIEDMLATLRFEDWNTQLRVIDQAVQNKSYFETDELAWLSSALRDLRRLALPHWITEQMLAVLLHEYDKADRQELMTRYLNSGLLEEDAVSERYRMPEANRDELLGSWRRLDLTSDWQRLSAKLAALCAREANAASGFQHDEWRAEELYHRAVADPAAAMEQMDDLFKQSVDAFHLNQAHMWLRALEERRDDLDALQLSAENAAQLVAELTHKRETLAARAAWTEEWYRTVNYLPRKLLTEQLNTFFQQGDPASPWVLSLYAPGGYGKTATIRWLLARYALPEGYVCARFDYDEVSPFEQLRMIEEPRHILTRIARNLNEQRAQKVEALTRLGELLSDRVAHFTNVLREIYGDTTIVIFIDTLEELLEHGSPKESEDALKRLLTMFAQVRYSDPTTGGGYANLRLVLSGRYPLVPAYEATLREGLRHAIPARVRRSPPLPVVEIEIKGFNEDESRQYLREKRMLGPIAPEVVDAVLEKATTNDLSAMNGIKPLNLAMYVDLIKSDPQIKPEGIRDNKNVDLAVLAKRILIRIDRPLRYLLRYGVVFRRLDKDAAQVLAPYIEDALANRLKDDDPDEDPPEMQQAMNAERDLAVSSPIDISALFEQLSRYSWIDRKPSYIEIQADVVKPQRELLRDRPIWKKLHRQALQYFEARAQADIPLEQQAVAVQEATYHALQLGEDGVASWHRLFERYRAGPGRHLWALVDETYPTRRRRDEEAPERVLSETDRFLAHLELARVLEAEKDRPFLPDQLEKAERAAQTAQLGAHKFAKWSAPVTANLVNAAVALANGDPGRALQLARASVEATNLQEMAVLGAEALRVLGIAEAANSRWSEAVVVLRQAYALSTQALQHVAPIRLLPSSFNPLLPPSNIQHDIRLTLIDHLLSSGEWRDARKFLDDARKNTPTNPQLLERAVRLAVMEGCLNDARSLASEALSHGDDALHQRLEVEQLRIAIYLGESLNRPVDDTSPLAVTVAAARADWPSIERALRAQLATQPETSALPVINNLLHYYLEVVGDRRQVSGLLDRASRWLAQHPQADPSAAARYVVLRDYVGFSNMPLEFTAAAAHQKVDYWWQKVETLQTPEQRVRAKGYLLLVRFFGAAATDDTSQDALDAQRRYLDCAARGLVQALDLLLQLAPLDQVDVMRTVAALPGWSSAIINEVGPDPAERSALLLLTRLLEKRQRPKQPLFLKTIAASHEKDVDERLKRLKKQITDSTSDWPVLYTSMARLMAAFGRRKAALEFMERARSLAEGRPSGPHVLVEKDRAFIIGGARAGQMIEELLIQLETQPVVRSLMYEVRLIWAYLSLAPGTTLSQTRAVATWLTEPPPVGPDNILFWQEYHLLRTIASWKLKRTRQALDSLRHAARLTEQLGNSAELERLQRLLLNLETRQSQRTSGRTGRSAPSSLPTAAQPISSPLVNELVLEIRHLDNEAVLHVTILRSDQPHDAFHHTTDLLRVRKLLLNGKLWPRLPDMQYWQKLLYIDSLKHHGLSSIGAALLDDLLPKNQPGRKLLLQALKWQDRPPPALRLVTQGELLERYPWGILFERTMQTWVAPRLRFSVNRALSRSIKLSGQTIAVLPLPTHTDPQGRLVMLAQFYARNQINVYGPTLLFQIGPSQPDYPSSTGTPGHVERQPIKMVHLVGQLSEISSVEGIFLNLGYARNDAGVEMLTPDALAHQLRRLGASPSLLVLEALATGSAFDDLRVLLLLNSYAAALSQICGMMVLAIGPHTGSSYRWLIEQLVRLPILTIDEIEQLVQEARGGKHSDSQSPFERQYILCYPQLLT